MAVVEAEKAKGGELLFCGGTLWDTIGKKKTGVEGNLYSPTRLRPLVGIDIRFVASGCVSCHCVALDLAGRCFTWGRNDRGQLGHGDTLQRDRPTVVSELSKHKIVSAAAGRSHTVVLTEDEQAFAFGWNKHGQLGSGSLRNEIESSAVHCQVSDVKTVACGGEFTVWLSSIEEFSILTAGLPQFGQLGHGTDNEYNSKDNSVRLVYEPQAQPKAIASFSGETIVKVACGTNHTVAVDSKGFVYTWGYGGYGRLGHREQKDEWAPRRIDVFTRNNVLPPDAIISAGGANCACTAAGGQLYMWGKLKPSGDDCMYPKPVMDLSGWNLRCMNSGNTCHFVGADSSCISWGQAQNGELGYGPIQGRSQNKTIKGAKNKILEGPRGRGHLRSPCSFAPGPNGQKTSTIPKKVDILEGMHVIGVACGLAHTMVVVDRTNVGDRLEQLDVYDGKASGGEGAEVIEPVSSAKKPVKKGTLENSNKRKKSKESSESEKSDQEEDQDVEGDGDDGVDDDGDKDDSDEDVTVNGNTKKKPRGGNTGKSTPTPTPTRGRGRPRGRPRK